MAAEVPLAMSMDIAAFVAAGCIHDGGEGYSALPAASKPRAWG
jgi:hypothetical protein